MKFRTIIEIQIREFDRRMLEKSWGWLNDPEIKRMTLTPDMDKKSQEEWFRGLKDRKDYYIAGVWRDDEPIGVLGIKHITSTDGELFGYIGEKKYWGKAVGVDMMKRTLDYGRSLGLSSVYSLIGKDNINSYKLHRRFGFKKEKEGDEDKIKMRLYF
ncbi:MAG TPA: GNAT family N-acetyltransferase [Dysgonamonadaceae bacterium]|nr:GNAT family N-acetyltransferase [Dysgonamonadaceae bacterium]